MEPFTDFALKMNLRIPGCPVVKTWCFHCHGFDFDPWSGNSDPAGWILPIGVAIPAESVGERGTGAQRPLPAPRQSQARGRPRRASDPSQSSGHSALLALFTSCRPKVPKLPTSELIPQAGFLCYSLEAEFLLLRETSVFALGTFN